MVEGAARDRLYRSRGRDATLAKSALTTRGCKRSSPAQAVIIVFNSTANLETSMNPA
jgi:hypothetical protein